MSRFTEFFTGKESNLAPKDQERSLETLFAGGQQYGVSQTLQSTGPVERPSLYADLAYTYRTNPIVFACLDVRAKLFSEARFQFRRRDGGRPGEFFGTPELLPIEVPWPNGDTGSLLTRAINDVDLHGNSYFVREGPNLRRLRPDWVSIAVNSASGNPDAVDAEIVGYFYSPQGNHSDAIPLLVEEVCHWKPVIDPAYRHLGMSPLVPAMAEIYADGSMTDFKSRYLDNGAAPSLVLTMPPEMNAESFKVWVQNFKAEHGQPENKGKPLFFANGTTATVVGSDLQKIDFKNVQGASETRIAACLGVPPVIAGLSEGLEASSYAHYAAARRRLFDGTISPLLRSFAAALETIITVPAGAYLTYDARDVAWLADDVKEAAETQAVNATAINTLITAGYEPASVVTAITTGDLSKLTHSGMTSVQLLKPTKTPSLDPVMSNGNGS